MLLVFISLCIFRVPVSFAFGAEKYSFLFNLLPFTSLLAAPKKRVTETNTLEKLFLLLCVISFISFIVYFFNGYQNSVVNLSMTRPYLSVMIGYFSLLMIITSEPAFIVSLKRVFDRLIIYILLCSTLLFILEYIFIKFVGISAERIFYYLYGFSFESKIWVNGYIFPSARSAILHVGCLLFVLHSTIEVFLSRMRVSWNFITFTVICFLAVFLMNSIISLLILLALLLLIFFSFFMRSNYKKIFLMSLGPVVIMFFSGVYFSPVYKRLIYYWEAKVDKLYSMFLPETVYCSVSDFFVSPSFFNVIGCRSREVNFLEPLFRYGALPTVAWYLPILFILIFSLKFFLKGRFHIPKVFLPFWAFLIAGFHYSGVESWGINYFFVICIGIIYSDFFCLQKESCEN